MPVITKHIEGNDYRNNFWTTQEQKKEAFFKFFVIFSVENFLAEENHKTI